MRKRTARLLPYFTVRYCKRVSLFPGMEWNICNTLTTVVHCTNTLLRCGRLETRQHANNTLTNVHAKTQKPKAKTCCPRCAVVDLCRQCRCRRRFRDPRWLFSTQARMACYSTQTGRGGSCAERLRSGGRSRTALAFACFLLLLSFFFCFEH